MQNLGKGFYEVLYVNVRKSLLSQGCEGDSKIHAKAEHSLIVNICHFCMKFEHVS